MINEHYIFLALAISVAGSGYYAYAAFRGKIKPNVVSWALWGLAPMIMFFAQRSEGSGIQNLFSLVTGLMPFVVLAAALARSHVALRFSKIDISCASIAVAALGLWLATGEGAVAMTLSILAGLCASLPTLLKGYRQPETERSTPFVAGVIAACITLLTLPQFTFESTAFSVYLILSNSLLAVVIMRPSGTTWPQGSKLDLKSE
jgi:hypothetical protein